MNNLFTRPETNYQVSDEILDAMLCDPANPLRAIVELVPAGAVVLDIGAGNGLLGRAFARTGKGVMIDAIEPSTYAAGLIPSCYRRVYTGFVQSFYDEIVAQSYDYVVLADVIEHIADPQPVLESIVAALSPTAKVLVSLPNVGFAGVRIELLRGNFEYTDSGLLEKTHLRFFTLPLALELFLRVGLGVERLIYLQRGLASTEFADSPRWQALVQCLYAFSPQARTYQYLFELGRELDCSPKVSAQGAGALAFIMDALRLTSVCHAMRRNARRVLKRLY